MIGLFGLHSPFEHSNGCKIFEDVLLDFEEPKNGCLTTQTRRSRTNQDPLSSKSGSSTPGLPISDCERRRKDLSEINKYDIGIRTRQQMTEFHRTLGDKKRIPELEALVKNLIDEKEKLVSELRNIPPCLDTDCLNHPLLKSTVIDPELTNPKIKKTVAKLKRKIRMALLFLKKTARPITPTKVLEPVQTQNNFENLTQGPEINVDQTLEKETPKPRSPSL
ncbi:hypothetical protein TNIN_130641 [Trichonephila inaurata madagascariensis]|uniref:Uncharacterized protein n=1 Tax=Trichonephila inaurata madagascariensis TaxID=2747483 RepID=A0A8X6XMN9_9ARAC|nr:hypothetical protein TNIN_130641 [Trichonephila inaurata madagascariensis]